MARLNTSEAREMASKGTTGINFFSLKDRETMKIRFLYKDIEEVESYSVHQITLADGKKKNVSCTRATNEPVQNCPLCAIGNKPRARIYLNVVNEKTHKLLVWERSAQFLDTLEGYIKRYGDLRDYIFEVERKGTGLDTEYVIYPLGQSIIEDKSVLPETPKILGTLLLDKSAQDLEYYINNSRFPEEIKPELERRETAPNPQQGVPNQPNNQGYAPQNTTGYQQPQQGYTDNDYNPWGSDKSGSEPKKRSGWN